MSSSLQLAVGITCFAAASCLVAASLIADPDSEQAVLLAALLATANALCALVLAHLGASRPSTRGFFGAVMGGMLLRMGTTLAGFAVGLRLLMLPTIPLALALVAYTGLFTAAELALWSRQDFSPRVRLS